MNAIEKRIKERAEGRFEREVTEFTRAVNKSPFGKLLKIRIQDKEKGEGGRGAPGMVYFIDDHNPSLFTDSGSCCNDGKENTNYKDIKEKLIAKYEQQEADDILSKLDILNHYINQ